MSLFDLPQASDIDYISTVRALKKFFEDYKILRLKAGALILPSVTTTYTITPPSFSNQFNSKVEDAAIHNIDNVQTAQDAVNKYDVIINQLDHFQRKIIIECFIHDSRDIDVMIDMPYEEAQYKREKRKGVIQLATTLGIEVLKQK